ncbi:MAG: hypothetical protein M3O31_17980 [Acidobacteriota bacterium]|nr:hypothetical protein [Acidobacteriota bacterium]
MTGRQVNPNDHAWLNGPAGGTRLIGKQFFIDFANRNHLTVVESGRRGLIEDFSQLNCGSNGLSAVAAPVKDFYEHTSDYDLDAWSQWCGLFKPFGLALAAIFSRRLQQLNIPLSSLDSSKGMSSQVLQLRDPGSGRLVQTAWVRELNATNNVLYAGSYSICLVPGCSAPCIKVVFPLPNGNAIVLMKTKAHADGSFSVTSAGNGFGDPGFYFTLHNEHGLAWARYVKSLEETIKVYPAEPGVVRADHILWFWGREFLRLHYRMRSRA